MKRILQLCLLAVLCLGYTWAQNTTQKQTKPGTPQARHDQMAAQHEQMLKGLQADVDGMKANLQKMKAQLANVKDQSTKDQLQLNITMWQTFIDNMDKHLQMMKSMGGPGHEHGEHGAMGPHDHDHDHDHDHEHHGGMATPSPSPKQ